MDDFNLNALWCRVILEELQPSGLRYLVTCVGGRSAAMVLVIRSRPDLTSRPHTDERSGAFVAFGLARASGGPAAVCTTSGSAVANLIPALMEAHHTRTPLLLLTCDRPRAQRKVGAPQTTDQVSFCAPLVVAALDLPDPSDDEASLGELRAHVRSVLPYLTDPGRRGPVQINIPLIGGLTSTELQPGWQAPTSPSALPRTGAAGEAPVAARTTHRDTATDAVDRLIGEISLRPGMRGLMLAGSNPLLGWDQIARFAEVTGFPILADTPSNLRRPAAPHVVVTGDILVLDPALSAVPADVIVRVGDTPVSHFMHTYVTRQACPVVRIDGTPYPRDFPHRMVHTLDHPSDEGLTALANGLARGDAQWLAGWVRADAKVCERRARRLTALPWGEVRAASIVCNARAFSVLHVSNSMAMRHANLLCDAWTEAQRVFVNRGVNGIDGTIGTFLGELWATGRKGLLLIGDQAALHDLTALEAARNPSISGCVCILNNAGGAIFDLLDCSRFEDYPLGIRNPSFVNFEHAVSAFQLEYRRASSVEELTEALDWSAGRSGVQVIEAVVPPDSLKQDITMLLGAMRSSGAAP